MGEVFAGRYELLELIGQGGMGSVWRVHDRRSDRIVAAKVLRQSDAASLLRFVRETAFRVQHPHVVTPLGWVGEDDRVLFTMPVVDGGSVSTLVGDNGPLPAPFVAEILRQLLDALAAVHASGIVHRDVNPANILLAATGSDRPHIYLTDFGIASELDGPRLTETHMALGTRGYMAPEQGRGELATASDLYAVGAVAGHMLTAQSPTGVGPRAFARPPGVPDAMWGLIMELLAEHPAQRPVSATVARHRLEIPELAWTPEASGEVTVLRQVEVPESDGESPPPPLRPESAQAHPPPPDVPAPAVSPPPGQPAAPGPTQPAAPGPTQPAGPGPTTPEPGAARAGSRRRGRVLVALGVVTVLAVLVALSFVVVWAPWSGGGGEDATDLPTVTRDVGDECDFTEVGLRGATDGGDAVRCTRAEDGTYAWESETGQD